MANVVMLNKLYFHFPAMGPEARASNRMDRLLNKSFDYQNALFLLYYTEYCVYLYVHMFIYLHVYVIFRLFRLCEQCATMRASLFCKYY